MNAPKAEEFPEFIRSILRFANESRKAFKVKKIGRIQLAKEIIARVKKEMQEPRLTESVRNGMRDKAAFHSTGPATRIEKL